VATREPRSTRETAVEETYLPRPTLSLGGERHVHISRNREHTREYHEIAIKSSTRRWNVMAPIGYRSRIAFYKYGVLRISFYSRPAQDAPLACVLSSRGLTRRDPCARAIDGDGTHAAVSNDPTAAPPPRRFVMRSVRRLAPVLDRPPANRADRREPHGAACLLRTGGVSIAGCHIRRRRFGN
jgi:hypothetical protein